MKINWPVPSFPWGGFCLALLWPSPIVQAPSHTHHRCRVCSRCHSTGMGKVPGVWEPASRAHFHSLSAKHKPCIKNSTMKRGTCSSAEHYLEKDWENLSRASCMWVSGTQKTENLRADLVPAMLRFCSSARRLCLIWCRNAKHHSHRPRAAQQIPAQPQALLPSLAPQPKQPPAAAGTPLLPLVLLWRFPTKEWLGHPEQEQILKSRSLVYKNR